MAGPPDLRPRPRRRRPLDPEEKALWEYVTRSIQPIRPSKRAEVARVEAIAEVPPEPAADTPARIAKMMPAPAAPAPKPPPGPPPLAPLEPKMRRRLSRGAQVDARLDLHGMTQAAAHGRLIAFLRGAQGSGHSLVLVITGKGEAMSVLAGEGGRGVLRRLVPQWLGAPELRSIVLGFETAGRGHGGEGALYVRVRRDRGGRS
ncbi:Smr/MutS family protein [Ancylobacter dichloromethanicus]|uniref:DNA mismatch repair protein MutS n=1 Tax=Ancylobacter dichloromethanicus TaxID=518825 RepID=A0A9W6J9C5_9HYPH|nr:Smr/MutS family protein [Ancylobacter dichloromethanicus]MBS7554911.1 Smr/MutS family protein [Ancylobacter dichloromethanicus]GLK73305.1 DNA mismatch repair protein MutS [Ancylobacter dichloromethanicus]